MYYHISIQKGENMKKLNIFTLSVFCLTAPMFLTSCATQNPALKTEQMTVAKAQREIKIGMSASDVVEVLGSPNMVTTDSQRRETWVYDRVSTNVQSANSGAGVWLLIFGASSNKSSASMNQRTLTIIVKFDENNLVRDFAYRSSAF